ncbi:MAG TPA: hypothetical protein VG410_15555 [Solirubrobacteraceae bacterium]|nr:hypothetical protein [Solirubrobacteraceae bacterium]
MTVGRYAWGIAALLITAGALGWAAVLLRRHWLPESTGAPARLAECVIGLAALIALTEALGAIGWLRLGPIVGAAILTAALTTKAAGGTAAVAPRGARGDGGGGAGRLVLPALGLIAGAVTIASWAAPTVESFDHGIRGFDSLWYHLPWAASFAQTGHITPLRPTDVEYLSQFYPATSELIHAVGIVLLGRDTLSPMLNLIWLGFSLLAAYCIGRPRGLGPLTALGAAIAFATPALVGSQAGSAANDIVGVFFLLAAVALWVGAEGSRAALALAAVAAGLALGTKLSLVAPVLALTVAVLIVDRRPLRWLVPLVVAGGYWYVRNLIAVGNPVPWTGLGGVLATPAPALQQNTGFSIVHYLGNSHVLTHVFGPGLVSALGPWWPLVLALTIAGPLLCIAWPGADRTTRALGAVAFASLLAYLLTPETAAGPAGHPLGFAFNLRYAAPVLALSLSIVPLAPPLARRPPIAAAALAIVFVLTAIKLHLWTSKHLAGALIVAAACAALAAALARRPPMRAVLAGAGALLVACVIAGYPWQRHYLKGRYAFQPGISALSHVWALFRGVHHTRVGVAGTFGMFFAYPLYGLDDSNRVQYIAARGPHGSFTPLASCRAWRAAVDAGGYRYVVTTPARDPWHPKPLRYSPERGWIASDPAARVVYEHRAFGQLIDVFALTGPLHPNGCPARPVA